MNTENITQSDMCHEAKPVPFVDKAAVFAMLFFAIVEYAFLRRLIALISNHSAHGYLESAFLFQACTVIAFVHFYRLCIGKKSVIRAQILDKNKAVVNISSLVVMMMFMLMMFSQVENSYQQIKP